MVAVGLLRVIIGVGARKFGRLFVQSFYEWKLEVYMRSKHMDIDLSAVQMHLDNFVATQEGWYKVLSGITDILSGSNLKAAIAEPIKALAPSS